MIRRVLNIWRLKIAVDNNVGVEFYKTSKGQIYVTDVWRIKNG